MATAPRPIRSFLYAGATTKIIGHTEVWFDGKHPVDPKRNPGYKSNDAAAVKKLLCLPLQAAGVDILSPNWYGPRTFEDQATQILFQQWPLGVLMNIDGSAFHDLQSLRDCITYIRQKYFINPQYAKWQGKYIVTFFAKAANDPTWFRQIEKENTDIEFVYNGTHFGPNQSQMAWVQHDLQANCEWFCQTFSARKDGLFIPLVSAGFDDTLMRKVNDKWQGDPNGTLKATSVWPAVPNQYIQARVWPAGIGPNWGTLAAFFDSINRHYSVAHQLEFVQLVVNDEDEGNGALSRGFLLPQIPASHLEVWADGVKLTDLILTTTQEKVTINQVTDADGLKLSSAELILEH